MPVHRHEFGWQCVDADQSADAEASMLPRIEIVDITDAQLAHAEHPIAQGIVALEQFVLIGPLEAAKKSIHCAETNGGFEQVGVRRLSEVRRIASPRERRFPIASREL